MYQEICVKGCTDSKQLYVDVAKIRSSVSVTDLGTSVWVYGDMTQEEFDEIIRICQCYGDID